MSLEFSHPKIVASASAGFAALSVTGFYIFPISVIERTAIFTNIAQLGAVLISMYVAIIIYLKSLKTEEPALRGRRQRLSNSVLILTPQSLAAFAAANVAIDMAAATPIALGMIVSVTLSTAMVLLSIEAE